MTTISFHADTITTNGSLPQEGSEAPDFALVDKNLETKTLQDFSGQRLILNIFPSIDTSVCSSSVRHFNQDASELDATTILCISKDLPFALGRFCGAEGIENVVMLSDFRGSFADDYGVRMLDGPLQGLMARAILVLDEANKVIYKEQVKDIAQEPNYEAALQAARTL